MSPLKVFAYEHITGGGVLTDAEPGPLAAEGELMLRAMVADLAAIEGIETTVLLDSRIDLDLPAHVHRISSPAQFWPAYRRALHEAQAAWIVAPEQNGVLEQLARSALEGGRMLLGSRPAAIRLAASKIATAGALQAAGIPVVPTFPSLEAVPDGIEQIVVKPDDGAGCQHTRILRDRSHDGSRRNGGPGPLIFQPLLKGEALSLSALFCEGRARLLCCNRQHVAAREDRLEFDGVTVNARLDHDGRYADLLAGIAQAVPGLWGYAGIDLIETGQGPQVL
ncbi:MAG TPA: ATP-grasp domain-containing protein, partial [Alphaproteobacteria bacterium]|nr:ATP-grasp domain-containing protein [Alphaproteobacteria bacterium]